MFARFKVCVASLGILLSAALSAVADPPAATGKILDAKVGLKVNSVTKKTSTATNCVTLKTCKKAHTQVGSSQGAGSKKLPGS